MQNIVKSYLTYCVSLEVISYDYRSNAGGVT